jgi:hypothetical protein
VGQADRTVRLLSRLSGAVADDESLVRLLAPGSVVLSLSRATAAEPQAQLLFTFAVNLLGRLYPVVQELQVVVPTGTRTRVPLPRWAAATVDDHARQFLGALRPPLRWSVAERATGSATCVLAVGPEPALGGAVVFVGSEGWIATVSPDVPVPVRGAPNPVGAYAAACMGVAEVWKRLLQPHVWMFRGVPVVPVTAPFSFSTFTYAADGADANPDLPEQIDVARLTVVGLGAGGAAVAHTLASTGRLHGALTFVEPDEVTETNLNRLVIADVADAAAERPKVAIAGPLFASSPGVRVEPLPPMTFGKATARLGRENYRYVVAAVHSREARRELQYETPMVLWDAGATEDGEFRIWRMVLGTTICMHCKHPPGAADPEQAKAAQLSALLGLDPALWLQKIRENDRFTGDEVARMTAPARDVERGFALPWPDQRYGDWEAEQCGRLKLPDADEEVPIPFAPVMAGVLLAGEIIKEHHFAHAVLDGYYWNTLLGRFMPHNRPRRRPPGPSCAFCHDAAFVAQYRTRWTII